MFSISIIKQLVGFYNLDGDDGGKGCISYFFDTAGMPLPLACPEPPTAVLA